MFQAAIDAAVDAAAAWSPERPDPAVGTRCCTLCLHRYRDLVLDGPLAGLPHGVVHAAVLHVDGIVAARVEGARAELERTSWLAQVTGTERAEDVDRRCAEAAGALRLAAREELAAARSRLDALRRAVEPLLTAYLDRDRMDEVPRQWGG